MRLLQSGAVWIVAVALSGCHLLTHKQVTSPPQPQTVPANTEAPPAMSPESAAEGSSPDRTAEESPAAGTESQQPCLPVGTKPRATARRKPKPVPQVVEATPPGPPVPMPAQVVREPEVRALPTTSMSVLGRKVQSLTGEDMGRVVDLLSDPTGGMRIAIIEFGGFLGVGNRRIAVDWALLQFHPEKPDSPLTLNVPKAKIQSAPDYKDGFAHPPVLMAPAATGAEGSQ